MPFFFIDYWYLILVIPAVLISLFAQIKVKTTFNKYSKVYARGGRTAADVARMILDKNGLHNVTVERVPGNLSDHYDPRSNTVRLSDSVYGSSSVSAIGVAAHEVGHAIQHAESYAPIKIRTAIIPVTNFGASISPFLILIGLLMGSYPLAMFGIALYSLMAVFQLVTLPVEFNASSRAIKTLDRDAILSRDEVSDARKVLSAAAMTYVAALLVSLAQILRLLLIVGGGRRRD
jgi:Zn-dependent membrane protease YugP